jgi:hypothetical protein
MPNRQETHNKERPMNNDNTETTESTTLSETELEHVKGGGSIDLDAFITVLDADAIRNMIGVDRPKGIYLPTDLRALRGV